MSKLRININGQEITGHAGQTILELAREKGIDIPTLCHDERVETYGACGLCTVEAEGNPRLLRACATAAADGMVITTDSPRIRRNRRAALELLLSDHRGDCRPPCALACPAETDCQGYVGLIANGMTEASRKLIMDKIPLPASIGRVCPHPCETACRRQLAEEPIAIAALKQYAGDKCLDKPLDITLPPDTGNHIAIVGGGPGGLSAAYYLRWKGHAVTIYDAMPHMGGMLRYGIPEYRLPKAVLQREIDLIQSTGITFRNNTAIGRDITLTHLESRYDAVILAIGAWQGTPLRCPGEELDGVKGGIDFLRTVALGRPLFTGSRVAIVGGGNTAMDACRTAVRLGADKVYNIYRRTKNEMPAEAIEIHEAEEEGVVFKNLTNPIEIIGQSGKVTAIRLQVMTLGEPDASGRRAPVPVPGKEELLEADTVISAIGQKPLTKGIEGIELTKWGTIAADPQTYRTSKEGVFAIGDATNKGADIAISAIGEAKKAAAMVDRYLKGEDLDTQAPFRVKSEKTAEDFARIAKQARIQADCRPAAERRADFAEILPTLTDLQARREAERCLECGCMDYFECKLLRYANEYQVQPSKYAGQVHHRIREDEHPYIRRNPDKCILCGLCVRICDQVVGATALGLVGRGFDTIVKPALDKPLSETDCISCGQCVSVCPTGALTEIQAIPKQIPLQEEWIPSVCSFCSVGCATRQAVGGGQLTRTLPDKEEGALLCRRGRFGPNAAAEQTRLTQPRLGKGQTAAATDYPQALLRITKAFQSLQAQYGTRAAAVVVSEQTTNEDAHLIQTYAARVLQTDRIYSAGQTDGGLADVLGYDGSTVTIDQMENAEWIIAIAPKDLVQSHPVAAMRIKRGVSKGAKLLLLSGEDSLLDRQADSRIPLGQDLTLLRQIAKGSTAAAKDKTFPGFSDWKTALQDAEPSENAERVCDILGKARRVVFVYDKAALSPDAVRLIAGIARLSGHLGTPRNGILQLLPAANSQGLTRLGFHSVTALHDALAQGEIRGLFVFGAELDALPGLDFLAVQEAYLTETAARADVALPAPGFAEKQGHYTAADGRVRPLRPALPPPEGVMSIFDQMAALCQLADAPLPYPNLQAVTQTLEDK